MLLATRGLVSWYYVNFSIRPEERYLDEAASFAARALDRDPEAFLGIFLRGLIAAKRADIEGAVRDMRRANERKPRDARPEPPDYKSAMINQQMTGREWGVLLFLALIWGGAFLFIGLERVCRLDAIEQHGPDDEPGGVDEAALVGGDERQQSEQQRQRGDGVGCEVTQESDHRRPRTI